MAHGAVPTFPTTVGVSIVNEEIASRDAYHVCPHAMHSSWIVEQKKEKKITEECKCNVLAMILRQIQKRKLMLKRYFDEK